jgi:copper homeostasis protein CutC
MAASIEQFTASGLLDPERGDGFVFGLLRYGDNNNNNNGSGKVELDMEGNKRLVAVAKRGGGFVCVLHRAVDDLFTLGCAGSGSGAGKGSEVDVEGVMVRVAECGFDGVLTSGGRGRAVDNMARLERVVEARGGVEVVVGGGVRSGNLRALVEGLGEGARGKGVWFHSSCFGGGEGFDEEEARALAEEMGDRGLVLQ